MRVSVTNWRLAATGCQAWAAQHKLRSEGFINRLAYDQKSKGQVRICNGWEFDQYDTPEADYVVVLKEGEAIACCRLISCASPTMLYDLWLEKSSKLPPNRSRIIEASRICTARSLTAIERGRALDLLIHKSLIGARERGGAYILGVMRPVLMKSLLKPRRVPFSANAEWKVDQQRCIIGLINVNDALEKFKPAV
ncbi:acyl-homoserine-lactone synthase [Polycladidibacter hongkongensis]|uniref:acyl-homoserine-lactone synthase n=1 Tax=Polycladidibacter hongkongensis TaxID=1647556 RepID=UPI00082D0E9D|nr:acyl-homoserine-lactone synthase [Pseudovibrio hongkongensis]